MRAGSSTSASAGPGLNSGASASSYRWSPVCWASRRLSFGSRARRRGRRSSLPGASRTSQPAPPLSSRTNFAKVQAAKATKGHLLTGAVSGMGLVMGGCQMKKADPRLGLPSRLFGCRHLLRRVRPRAGRDLWGNRWAGRGPARRTRPRKRCRSSAGGQEARRLVGQPFDHRLRCAFPAGLLLALAGQRSHLQTAAALLRPLLWAFTPAAASCRRLASSTLALRAAMRSGCRTGGGGVCTTSCPRSFASISSIKASR